MAWFKVDDKLWGHPKWLACSPRARALWVTAGSWCADQLTDGHVPTHVLPIIGGTKRDADELVRLSLWKPHEQGWDFHDWLEFQPSAQQVRAERAASKERQKRAREAARAKREAQRKAAERPPEEPPEEPPVTEMSRRDIRRDIRRESQPSHTVSHGPPDPTRPDPTVVPTELQPSGGAADAAAPSQRLIGEWIDMSPKRPPRDLVGQMASNVKSLLNEGISEEDVRAGIALLHRKRLHPRTLSSAVHEARLVAAEPEIPSRPDVPHVSELFPEANP